MLDIDSLVKYIILFIDKNVNRYELKRTQFYRDYLSQQHRFYKLRHLCHQQIEGIIGIGPNLIDKAAKPSLYMLAAKSLHSGSYGLTGGFCGSLYDSSTDTGAAVFFCVT